MNTTKRIKRYINSELLDGAQFMRDPFAAGILDSLSLEQLLGFVEHEFGFRFDDDDLQPRHFASLDAFADLVDSKRRKRR